MDLSPNRTPEQRLETHEDELSHLRARLAQAELAAERARGERLPQSDRERTLSEELARHRDEREARGTASPSETAAIVLDLAPESHDSQVGLLLAAARDRGVGAALSAAHKLGNPHIEDDFHRALVEYIREGYPAEGVRERDRLWKVLHMTLYEILLPELPRDERARERSLKELLSSMEQFYSGMRSFASGARGGDIYALELALPNIGEEVSFYAAVPSSRRDLFEKQLLAVFPRAELAPQHNDYNIFNEHGSHAAAVAAFGARPALPLRLYESFDYDPLNVIANAFSKIERAGEGAAFQFLIRPSGGERHQRHFHAILKKVREGMPLKEALELPESMLGEFAAAVRDFVFQRKKSKREEEEARQKPPRIDEAGQELLERKVATPLVEAAIRIVASAGSEARARAILDELIAAFHQFEDPQGNSLRFSRLSRGALHSGLRSFSFRETGAAPLLPLSLRELTTLFHFPVAGELATPQVRRSRAASGAAPALASRDAAPPQARSFQAGVAPPKAASRTAQELQAPLAPRAAIAARPNEGTVLGVNRFRGAETRVSIAPEDRLRHLYVIGQTGTGKSTLLRNMIVQDIAAGEGVCMIDPHGSDVAEVLATLPRERYGDVIYFDPGYSERPMALNMLEYDPRYPEQKTFVVNELLGIFRKLFGSVPESMGPAFEQYFRNSALLVMEDPASGNTLLDVARVLSDKRFRAGKLAHNRNPLIAQFWENAERTTGEQALANFAQYVTNKFDVFLSNDIVRPIIAQQHSAFAFRDVMDGRKILLVNLAKGRLGDINAHLIGLILVGKILMAALSRVDTPGRAFPPFYLYLDEFQNITTDSIAVILSEARKYGLALTVAHQFIGQLTENIRDAVFGNVGSLVAFRVGADDAEALEKQFAPAFTAHDLMNIENRNAYVRLLARGRPTKPFTIETEPPVRGEPSQVEALKQLSYTRYGRPREEVENEILERYRA